MKRVLPFLIILVLLVSCSPARTSDTQMATRVAGILTSQPSAAPGAVGLAATDLAPTALPATSTSLPSATFTTEPSDTPTVEPSPLPSETAAPEPSATNESLAVSGASSTSSPVPGATAPISSAAAATSTPPPTLTPMVSPTPLDPAIWLGPPNSLDEMDDGDAWGWPSGTDFRGFTTLKFYNGELLLTGLQLDKGGWRLATVKPLRNFYLEATARLDKCRPDDKFGLIFRVPVLREADQGYIFGITCDGEYYLRKWDGKVPPEGKSTTLIANTANSAIQAGPVSNRLGVMAVGADIWLYVNDVLVGQYRDTSFSSGYFGVYVTPIQTESLTVRVDQMRYWENPRP